MANAFVLRFLSEHKDQEIYQKDIEKYFFLKKSTITGTLNCLEENGYIERMIGKNDGRLRRIILTEKGSKINTEISNEFKNLEDNIYGLFSPEEYDNLIASLNKVKNYLEGKND